MLWSEGTILFITVCSEMTVGVGPEVTNVRAEGGGGGGHLVIVQSRSPVLKRFEILNEMNINLGTC